MSHLFSLIGVVGGVKVCVILCWGYTNPRLNEQGNRLKSVEFIKLVEKKGWVLVRTKGSHHHFKHPDQPHILTIPHPKQQLGKGLLKKLIKQAGL